MAGHVNALQLWRGLSDGSIPMVLDIRSPDDVAVAPVEGPPGTLTMAEPLWRVLDDVASTASRLADGSVIVCAHGNGSAMVADLLADHGRWALSLEEGMAAWNRLLVPEQITLESGTGPGAGTGLEVWQLLRPAKGCLSYVMGVSGAGAVVVDPARHLDAYLQLLDRRSMKLVAVVDTHLHADHLTGGPSLAAATGVPYVVSPVEAARPDRQAGDDPEVIELDEAQRVHLMRLRLPGHTPGSTAISIPGVVLAAGDTLFRTGVGRPDLTGQADELARLLFESIHEQLSPLPRTTLVLPAHWSSPDDLDGRGTVSAPLGDVLATDVLAGLDVDAFASTISSTLTPAPAAYERIRAINAGAPASQAEMEELEVGRNQCAAAPHRP